MEAETKVSEASDGFQRAINLTTGLKGSPSNDPVANRNLVGAATNETVRGSTNDMMPGVLAADALKGNMHPKVGVDYCCTPYG